MASLLVKLFKGLVCFIVAFSLLLFYKGCPVSIESEAFSSKSCIWPCKTLFCTVDSTIYKVEFEIGGEIGNEIGELLEIA
jgi:hypothetical protein